MNKNFSWEPNAHDASLFGFNTALIKSISLHNVQPLIADLKKSAMHYAVYRLKASDFPLIHELEQNGFVIIDGFLELTIETAPSNESENIVRATAKDIPELRKLAGSIFETTRFFNDPIIPNEKARQLYSEWIENSVNKQMADETFIYKEGRDILGFATISVKKTEIPLVGVARHTQGKGISRKLIIHALSEMNKLGIKTAHIGTQIQNIPALRSYLACGFKVSGSFLTFRWSDLSE